MPRIGVSVFIISSSALLIAWRLTYIQVFTAPEFLRRALIVGAGRAGNTLAGIVRGMWPHPFHVVGLIDDDPEKAGLLIEGFPVVGSSADLLSVIERDHISDVIFAISNEMRPEMFQALLKAAELGVEITNMPVVYEQLLGRVPIFLLQSDWILRSFVVQAHVNGLYVLSKRLRYSRRFRWDASNPGLSPIHCRGHIFRHRSPDSILPKTPRTEWRRIRYH
jgi:hypothetical protein